MQQLVYPQQLQQQQQQQQHVKNGDGGMDVDQDVADWLDSLLPKEKRLQKELNGNQVGDPLMAAGGGDGGFFLGDDPIIDAAKTNNFFG